MIAQGEVQQIGQLLIELHFWGRACLENIAGWFKRHTEICRPWLGRRHAMGDCFKTTVCSEPQHTMSSEEVSEMAGVLHGLQQGGLGFFSILANPVSTASKVVARSADGNVMASLDGALCCYEVGLSQRGA